MTWDDVKTAIAPTVPALAALLEGEMASLAQSTIGNALAGDAAADADTVKAAIDAAGDQAAPKLREAESAAFRQMADALGGVQLAQIDAATSAKRLDTLSDLEAKAAQDRADARAHQLQAKDWWTNPLLAAAVTAGFFGVVYYCLRTGDAQPNAMAQTLLGVLGTAWISIINFYFGSSVGSKEKTKLLATTLPPPPAALPGTP